MVINYVVFLVLLDYFGIVKLMMKIEEYFFCFLMNWYCYVENIIVYEKILCVNLNYDCYLDYYVYIIKVSLEVFVFRVVISWVV